MNKTLKAAVVALALAGGAAIGVASVSAAEVVVFDPGSVAYGYKDGYWTRKHEWHAWGKPDHVEIYRKHAGAEYHEWAHDRDKDMGWREIK